MKKIRNIGFALGLIILISTNSNAQYYYTSFGYANSWNVPSFVEYSIYNNYYGYDIAHVQRYAHPGYTNFNVLLHRNGAFVEVRFNRYGNIYKTIRYNNYPLMAHVCTYQCGYHHNYYTTYYPTYHTKVVYVNSNHGNQHNNHQHNYYTNVYVDKHNNGHSNGNHNSNNNGRHYGNSNQKSTQTTVLNQPQRTSMGIRKPQQTSSNTTVKRTPESNGRTQQAVVQRTSNNTRTNRSTTNATINRSGRGTQNR